MTREASRRYAEKNRELLARKRRDARAADPDKARAQALKTSRKQAGCILMKDDPLRLELAAKYLRRSE